MGALRSAVWGAGGREEQASLPLSLLPAVAIKVSLQCRVIREVKGGNGPVVVGVGVESHRLLRAVWTLNTPSCTDAWL